VSLDRDLILAPPPRGPVSAIQPSQPVKMLPGVESITARNDEEAARQQGGLFLRENSSNGGKAIRTFWLHTKFGQIRCQGEKFFELSHYYSSSYFGMGEQLDSLFIRSSADAHLSKAR
jgi:hypothetical protein